MKCRFAIFVLACCCLQVVHGDGPKAIDQPKQQLGKSAKKAQPHTIAFSSDGKLLACAQGPGMHADPGEPRVGVQVRVWDIANNKELGPFECKEKGAGISARLVVSPDSTFVALATYHEEGGPAQSDVKSYTTLRVWDIAKGEALDHIKRMECCYGSEISRIAFSADSRFLITLRDGQVERWKVNDGSRDGFSYKEKNARGGIYRASLDSNAKYLAYHLNKNPIEIWDIAQKKSVTRLEDAGTPIAFTSKTLMTRADKKILLFETATFKKRGEFQADAIDLTNAIVPSENGNAVAYVKDKVIHVFDVASKKVTHLLKVDAAHVAFAPDGKALASYNRDGTVSLWEIK